jgi:serine/threonine protein kinase
MSVCARCGLGSAALKCGRCKLARYCSASCQKLHWAQHKASCLRHVEAPSFEVKPTYDDFAVAATELGHGNYSTVYRATHKRSKCSYALKVIDKERIRRMAVRHPNINHEVLQEKHLGVTLAHSSIARLHSTFQDEGRLYFLYDLIPGGELWTYLTAPLTPILAEPKTPAPVSGRVAALVAIHLIKTLKYLHSMGVVHRDLKPENIMLKLREGKSSCGEALWERLEDLSLIDFATAKDLVHPEHNSRSEFVGTPDYMAPEVIDNSGAGRGVPADTRVRVRCWRCTSATLDRHVLYSFCCFYPDLRRLTSGASAVSYIKLSPVCLLFGAQARTPRFKRRSGTGPR